MGNINLKAALGGQIAVAPTNTASNYTLTLPAATGNIITSADSGTVTQAMLASNIAGNGPIARAYLNTDTTITSSTWTKVPLASTDYNTPAYFNTSTNRYTPLVAGYYLVSGSVADFGSTSPTFVQGSIYKNGVSELSFQPDYGTSGGVSTLSGLVYMNGSTDYIELYGFVVASTAKFRGVSSLTYMSATLVRAA